MHHLTSWVLLPILLLLSASATAQLIVTDPAAPTDDQAVTITFDATEGTAGLADCNCDVYLHTGVITQNSTGPSDWQYVQTEWGVANADWRLSPVSGQDNVYTYTFGPSIREYFGVPAGESIERLAFVFRNADGTLEGKASGGADIFVDVSAGGGPLGLTLAGDPGTATYPLGRPLALTVGATASATIEIFDNDVLVASTTGTELTTEVVLTTPGQHTIRAVATADGETAEDSFTVDGEFVVEIESPANNLLQVEVGDVIDVVANTFVTADISLNGQPAVTATTASESITITETTTTFTYTVTASYLGETAEDFFTVVIGGPAVEDPPAGLIPGLTEAANGDVSLLLRAPGKEDVFVVGSLNNWTPTDVTRMKRSVDGGTFWVTIPSAEIEGDLLYQYLIDGNIQQPDPYAKLILDPNSDRFIDQETFPNIPDYPSGAIGLVTWHRRNVTPYEWQTPADYDGRPDPGKMVVYELLMRDFLNEHNYETLLDTLDYLQRLGVNAIEFMPVSEFENNNSWGYNVSFHNALDKYYGTPEDFKAVVDECHSRGMAVILDVVYNHAFGQSSLARMWWDENAFRPTPDNPYLNVTARHPFNVGYDFNHESELTKEFLKVTTQHWLEEFRVDGFRFDLSKGFTQVFSNDVGQWNRYDASRVAIIKDYADHIWSVNENAYMIMEHLSDRQEEVELANYGRGMYFWSGFNPHDQYLEASMGYTSNLRDVVPANRGFDGPNLVAYMESHDEQRMMYKNERFGNRSGDYDVREIPTGLDRVALASAFFYTVPGPKMLWQFGELGYGFGINRCPNGTTNEGCRTDPKPIRWNYKNDPDRADLYNTTADLLWLRNNYDIFHGSIDKEQLSGSIKILNLSNTDGVAAVVGNFGVTEGVATAVFPSAGDWYDYFSGETITVTDPAQAVTLAPGEWHLWLDQPIVSEAGQLSTATNDREVARLSFTASPNPTAGDLRIGFELPRSSAVTVDLLDATGRVLQTLHTGRLGAGPQVLTRDVKAVANGLYFLRITDGAGTGVQPLVINR